MPIPTSSPCPHYSFDVWANVLQRMMPYKHNGNDLDQCLIRLVVDVVKTPPSEVVRRQAAIDRFLKAIYMLPNLYLPKHQQFSEIDRETVRDRILSEQVLPQVRPKIHEFYPTGKFLAPTLGKWINEKLRLKYFLLDEYKTRPPEASLDNDLNGINEHLEWKAFMENPTLDELDQIIADQQAKQPSDSLPAPQFEAMAKGIAAVLGHMPTQRFITYVNEDPKGVLRSKTVPKFPDCTYQVLIQRIYLKDLLTTKQAITDKTKQAIADKYGINYHTLNAHYNRHVTAFIDRLILEEGFFDETAYPKLKQYIEQDPQHLLQNCCMRNRPQVNAQFLAQRRLRICSDAAPHPFETLVKDQAIATYRLTPEQLKKFWMKDGFPLVAQMALRVLAYDLEV